MLRPLHDQRLWANDRILRSCHRIGCVGAHVPALLEVRHKVRGDVADVVFRAMNEARFAAAHEVEPERIETGYVDDAALVTQTTFPIQRRYVQPGMVGSEASGPDHRAEPLAFEVETETRRVVDLSGSRPLTLGPRFPLQAFVVDPFINPAEQTR